MGKNFYFCLYRRNTKMLSKLILSEMLSSILYHFVLMNNHYIYIKLKHYRNVLKKSIHNLNAFQAVNGIKIIHLIEL